MGHCAWPIGSVLHFHAQTGRSANRGDCSQACRLPYTLKDDQARFPMKNICCR
ncbi:U32 family peptidase [Escherichia coli]